MKKDIFILIISFTVSPCISADNSYPLLNSFSTRNITLSSTSEWPDFISERDAIELIDQYNSLPAPSAEYRRKIDTSLSISEATIEKPILVYDFCMPNIPAWWKNNLISYVVYLKHPYYGVTGEYQIDYSTTHDKYIVTSNYRLSADQPDLWGGAVIFERDIVNIVKSLSLGELIGRPIAVRLPLFFLGLNEWHWYFTVKDKGIVKEYIINPILQEPLVPGKEIDRESTVEERIKKSLENSKNILAYIDIDVPESINDVAFHDLSEFDNDLSKSFIYNSVKKTYQLSNRLTVNSKLKLNHFFLKKLYEDRSYL